METDLQGKVVLITGASGGIGSAIARAFAAEKARVVLHYHRRRAAAVRLQQELAPGQSIVVQAALTRETDVRRLFRSALQKFQGVDVLVANAGRWHEAEVPLARMSTAQWRQTLSTDLDSVFYCCREFLKLVKTRGRGNVVLIGSTAALFGEAGHADYAAAKSALAFGLTQSLKNEIARLAPPARNYPGARVNCVCPGWTMTSMVSKTPRAQRQIRRALQSMSLPRMARPDDVAHAAVFLASDRLACHITGQVLSVAGGMEGRSLWDPHEINLQWI